MAQLIPQASGSFFKLSERDILQELLNDRRSPNTRRAYERCLRQFFQAISGQEPTPTLVSEFLQLPRQTAISYALAYKASLIERGLSEATVNQHLAALKALVQFAQDIGKCEWSFEVIKGEKIQSYRDTRGVDADEYRKLLAVPDRGTLKGRRDYALLRLLWDNALRRDEARRNISDFNEGDRTLRIRGKGKGTQTQVVSLSTQTTEAIAAWVKGRGTLKPSDPLWIAMDNAHYGYRLTGSGIYNIVQSIATQAGINRAFSPHRIRHSSITAALDSGQDVRRVQRLSRHARLETLMLYDDNRQNIQGEVSNALSDLID